MAHFRATIHGARGPASRLGGKSSGINANIASWQGAVSVYLSSQDGVDWADVRLTPHHGAGIGKLLYNGPVGGKKKRAQR